MIWRYCSGNTCIQERKASRAISFQRDEKEDDTDRTPSQAGMLNPFKRWSMSYKHSSPRGSEGSAGEPGIARPKTAHRRAYSGGSDRKALEADRAHERLALEREDYERNRRNLQVRQASVMSQHASEGKGSRKESRRGSRKEWFDQNAKGELFADHALDANEKQAGP